MTDRERLVVSAYTGVLMCDFAKFQSYVEELLGRPVFTHEMGLPNTWEEIKKNCHAELIALCGR